MADINSSFDEILRELGNGFDEDIAPRKLVRSTANKIWLMLRAFSRGLYGVYQVIAALKYRFDPLYCTDEELASTMRLVGTTRAQGKASLLTVTIHNTHPTEPRIFPVDTYSYASANGTTFLLTVFEPITVLPMSFVKRDFFSSIGGTALPGAYSVSDNSGITITAVSGATIDLDFSFSCEDNSGKLGRMEETLFEVRQRILTDNTRQEALRILEERLQDLPNIHECTILSNKGLSPANSPYLKDGSTTEYVPIMPQSIFILLTGSPTEEFAKQVLTLCPFITVIPEGVADYGVVNYPSPMYLGGNFPVYYVPHRIKYYDVIVEYGFSSAQISQNTIEAEYLELLLPFKSKTKFQEIISAEEFSDALSTFKSPSVRLLSVTFVRDTDEATYLQFNRTQIARLANVSFVPVSLWN